jgi:hypothetical protein
MGPGLCVGDVNTHIIKVWQGEDDNTKIFVTLIIDDLYTVPAA